MDNTQQIFPAFRLVAQFADGQRLTFDGLTEQQALSHYDTVLHLVSCAKGAEFAYNFGNEARYEPLELSLIHI